MGTPDPNPDNRDALLRFIKRYGPPAGPDGPARFVREVIGATPDFWQWKVLREYGSHARQISIESCHGPGKTALLAWLILVQLATRFPQKSACTAPTKGQLYDALFAEVKTWLNQLPGLVRDWFEVKGDRIELKLAPERSFATFKTARPENPEALQGVHAPWVLLIVDEADGVAQPIFESAIGSMSGTNATTVLAGNPVRTTGFFYNANHGDSPSWKRYHVTAIEGPHCGRNSFVSNRVSKQFVQMVEEEYGRDSGAFSVRVLGRPPSADSDAIIPFEWIETAWQRDITADPHAPIVWGVDVARSGEDLSVLCKRQANVLMEHPKTWTALNDLMLVCGVIKTEWDQTALQERPTAICVDAIGLGAGVADRLREMGLPAIAVNVAENAALNPVRFRNLRTELYYSVRDWFGKRDCYIPKDERLIQELAAQKVKILDSSGKLIAIPKREMMKYIHPRRSPDRGDAFALTFAAGAAQYLNASAGLSNWKEPLRRNVKGYF